MRELNSSSINMVSGGHWIRVLGEIISGGILIESSGASIERGFREASRDSYSDYYDYVDISGSYRGLA